MTSTRYFYSKDASTGKLVLRHGHPMISEGTRPEWHAANTVHWDAPTLHTEYDAWNAYTENWNPGQPHLTAPQRVEMIKRAEREHRATQAMGKGSSLPTTNEVKPIVPPATPPTQPITTDNPTLTAISNRVTNIETLAAVTADMAKTAMDGTVKTREMVSIAQQDAKYARTELDKRTAAQDAKIAEIETKVNATRRITHEVKLWTGHTVEIEGRQHKLYDVLLDECPRMAPGRRNFWLAGPAGVGKTTLVENFARALNLHYMYQGAAAMRHDIAGFMGADATTYHTTPFVKMYLGGDPQYDGACILLDETDASFPVAMMELNAALANQSYSSPLGMIPRGGTDGKPVYVFAAANTTGVGGDAKYAARFKQDAAFLDRFGFYHVEYDNELESSLVGPHAQEWCKVVQECRKLADDPTLAKVDIVISPRSTFRGSDLLAGPNPVRRARVLEMEFGARYKHYDWYARVFAPAIEWAAKENDSAPAANNTTPSGGLRVDMSKAVVYGSR